MGTVKYGIKYLIHSQTSKIQSLKFAIYWNGWFWRNQQTLFWYALGYFRLSKSMRKWSYISKYCLDMVRFQNREVTVILAANLTTLVLNSVITKL